MVTKTLMTADELVAMGDQFGRMDLIEGALHHMAPAGGRHGRVGAKFIMGLGLDGFC